MHEREQQRMRLPRRPRRSTVTIERSGIEEDPGPVVSVGHLRRIDRRTGRRHINQPGRIPQHREVVNVHAMFEKFARLGADHRYRRCVEISPVLINGHTAAVADQPTW